MAVCLLRGEEPAGGDYLRRATAELAESAAAECSRLSPEQKYLRGLFCGGTHSEEAVTLLKGLVHRLHSNISFGGAELLEDRYLSVENSLVDMGDEVFTKGRPHPVMDPSILMDRLIQEAHDPETGVILFDLLYGYAIHPDPVGAHRGRAQGGRPHRAGRRPAYLPRRLSLRHRHRPSKCGGTGPQAA